MRKQIFRSICVVAFAVLVAVFTLIMGRLYNYFTSEEMQQLAVQTELASKAVNDEGMTYFKHMRKTTDYRITWIDSDGTVLYDNQEDAKTMDNHANRTEVKQALKKGIGQANRRSNTIMHQSLYYALKLDDGTVLRLSCDQNTVWSLAFTMMQPIFGILILIILLSLFLARRVSNRIVEPLNNTDLDNPLVNDHYEELTPFLTRIDQQQVELKAQSRKLHQKEEEFDAVTNNMNEGLILLNREGIILSINRKAKQLLGGTSASIGKDILTVNRSLELNELLDQCREGQQSEIVYPINREDYQLIASPIFYHQRVSGMALLMLNVTEKEQAEKLRREFTANVSHELKTPLHTISGCAELLQSGMVKPEDQAKFVHEIYREAQRMIALVEDIIKLSHLDEGTTDMQYEQIDLYTFTQQMLDSLADKAQGAQVQLALHGKHETINAIPQLLQSIVYNICDNAIKYNHPGGHVDVTVDEDENNVIFKVKDDGIGIPLEHQARIFERFYRVDKSHSKAVGGTGLGLSIVKHAAQTLHAKLFVDSKPNQGTTMTVWFLKD